MVTPMFKRAALVVLAIVTIMATTFFVGSAPAEAAQASISWQAPATNTDGSPITNLAGYKVHIGSSSQNYQQHIDVGNTTSYSTSSLLDGSTYFFAVTAYDSSKVESAYSNEISKTFAALPTSYTITATAGAGGTITALNNTKINMATSGSTTLTTVTVSDGASQSFNIAAATGYSISNVVVDGASVGPVTSYTFSTVKANHSISASFTASTVSSYTISASALTGGSITPAGSVSVANGGSKTFTITPSAGYVIKSLQVDGQWIRAASTYTFSNVTANHSILAAFTAVPSYTISASALTGGSISPAGSVSVTNGGSKTFTITPSAGYVIKSLQVDGQWIRAASTYTFSNVTANHSILAAFTAVPSYTITASAGTGGSISPAGSVSVTQGASKTFTITPSAGYSIKSLQVDGQLISAAPSYTFSNITSNHTIAAIFAATAGKTVFAVNCGGTGFTDSYGIAYKADYGYSGGSTTVTTSTISGTVDDVLYQTGRFGNFAYNIPLPNGNYTVTLRFADWGKTTGQRIFDVKAEGSVVINDLDIYSKVGSYRAYDVKVPVSVADGVLNLAFIPSQSYFNAKVNAILVQTR